MDTGSAIAFSLVGGLALLGIGAVFSSAERIQSDEETTSEFLRLVDDKSPQRNLKSEELAAYGHDASQGVVFGNANGDVRLYCIGYFDGTSAAFVDHVNLPRKRVDMSHCEQSMAG